jgi:hypothetical protein
MAQEMRGKLCGSDPHSDTRNIQMRQVRWRVSEILKVRRHAGMKDVACAVE